MSKKISKSRYSKGDMVMLTNNYEGVVAGHIFTVENPNKVGHHHKILVVDLEEAFRKQIPSKYLRPLRRK